MVINNSLMPAEIREFADFANSAYKDNQNEREEAIKSIKNSWSYLKEYSDKYTAVWLHSTKPLIIIANRGTKVTDPVDLLADANVAFSSTATFQKSTRFLIAKKRYLVVKADYPNHEIILAGHSLGGSVNNSVYSNYENSIQKVYNYNPGSGVSAGFSNLFGQIFKKQHSKVFNNFIKNDPISILAINEKEKNTKVFTNRDKMFPHLLGNFINKP